VLVTLVATKENCFHEPFKTIKTVRISKFIWQQVPNCRAGIVERPTAVRAKSTARHSETETVPVVITIKLFIMTSHCAGTVQMREKSESGIRK